MVDVGIRRRRELLLVAVMKDLPDTKDDWGTYIRSKLSTPAAMTIPLTKNAVGAFPDPSFDPEQVAAAADLFTALKAYGDFGVKHAPDDRPIMDYQRLLDEYTGKSAAWNAWYRDSFQDYWNNKVPDALAVREDLTWAEFRNALKKNLDTKVIDGSLALLADKQALARTLKPPAAPSLAPAKLVDRVEKCKRSWSALDNDAASARLKL